MTDRLASEVAAWIRAVPLAPLRRRVCTSPSHWTKRLPAPLLRSLDLDGDINQPLRVEIGSGSHPTPGYVHVDSDRHSRHLEHVAPMWDLPFGSSTVAEILAIHTLEHIHPPLISSTLHEWYRVLRPGGTALIHVPNGPALLGAFEKASVCGKWALNAVIYGYGGGPEVSSAEDIGLLPFRVPEHRTLFDFELLRAELAAVGFVEIEDLTGSVGDRHTDRWGDLVPGYSLVVRAARRLGPE